jgi:protein O-GlcNAc transferase
LVDLKGYTSGARLEIPAQRPAPIQISYLGFPGTTGADFFDYIITDKTVTPPIELPYYREKAIFLPDCYQINDNKQTLGQKGLTKKNLGLPENTFLFCSFNQSYKIDSKVFASWMKILKNAPKSSLCLLYQNELQSTNLKKRAKKHGIDPKRIVFALSLNKDAHIARLSLCDLALDTFTYGGMTTTSDALWAGLPVVTVRGRHFASRASASLLFAIGLDEMVTDSPKEYEDWAIELAKNKKKLQLIREKLRNNRLTYPLFDTQKQVDNIEKAYFQIMNLYKDGKRPKTIYIK